MPTPPQNFWPSARQFAEAVQCPALCFTDPYLKSTQPAIDRLGMPLVTSGQFAYVFKLKAAHSRDSLAVRCFRGYMGDREARYKALDAHLNARQITALPQFNYQPQGILVGGRRYPILVMQWLEGPTLDVYLEDVIGRADVIHHLADEWLRLVHTLREARVAHGDLQHGNIIVERGQLRLVDLDGMFVPSMEGWTASEIGHQHYQHPARDERFFSADLDNFSALVVYLSLVSLAERPELWSEHHDENLLFTKADFLNPGESALFRKVKEIGEEHRILAETLERAARGRPADAPSLLDLVEVESRLPGWLAAPPDLEIGTGRTREVARAEVQPLEQRGAGGVWVGGTYVRGQQRGTASPQALGSSSVQTIFGAGSSANQPAPLDPKDIQGNTLFFAKRYAGRSMIYFWWLPAHRLLGEIWAGMGVMSELGSLFLTFVLLLGAFLLAGLLRAFYEMETAVPGGVQAAGAPPPQQFPAATPPAYAPAAGQF
ncbi:MAG TPA: hypothetical protein VER08_06730, partial [Pyrinomonadaceae bacterium]|nr:hypothetical protein [Pyrinomonadaceae bacterium]